MGADAVPSGIRPPADQKGPLFKLFWDIHFWLTDPKIFLKAPLASIYTNFEWWARAKKSRDTFAKVFQKLPKTPLFGLFFKSCLRRRKFYQTRVFILVWEGSENLLGWTKEKKCSSKMSKLFWNSANLEKFLDPRLIYHIKRINYTQLIVDYNLMPSKRNYTKS